MKSQVPHTVWCYISCEAAGEIWSWSLLGVKGLSWESAVIVCPRQDWTKHVTTAAVGV